MKVRVESDTDLFKPNPFDFIAVRQISAINNRNKDGFIL
jgi:hypothetical protein